MLTPGRHLYLPLELYIVRPPLICHHTLIMKLALVCLLASGALTAPSSHKDMDMRAATCKCGVKAGSNRIVGGVEAKVNEFPWIASLSLNVSWYNGVNKTKKAISN